jgi:hypothetical protein
LRGYQENQLHKIPDSPSFNDYKPALIGWSGKVSGWVVVADEQGFHFPRSLAINSTADFRGVFPNYLRVMIANFSRLTFCAGVIPKWFLQQPILDVDEGRRIGGFGAGNIFSELKVGVMFKNSPICPYLRQISQLATPRKRRQVDFGAGFFMCFQNLADFRLS